MTARQIQVYKPVAEVSVPERKTAALLDTLEGKRIGYHHARGPYLTVVAFADRVGELLVERYCAQEIKRLKAVVDMGASGWSDPRFPDIARKVYDQYAQEVDAVIVGAAFCGGSTYWSQQAAADFQDRGIPTVSLASLAFSDLARFTHQTRGYPELPMLILPDDFETKRPHEMHRLAEKHVEELVSLVVAQPVHAGA